MLSKRQVANCIALISELKDNKAFECYLKAAEEALRDFREEYIAKMRKLICADYPAINTKEYEILGRAIQGCNQISILDDGSVYNAYNYGRKNTNATWRAGELIDEDIKELEKEREV